MENKEVGTVNPKVGSYLPPELYRLLKDQQNLQGIGESEVVRKAVEVYVVTGFSLVALPDNLRTKLEVVAKKAYRSPEDQARFLLREAIEKSWEEAEEKK
jgi:hypothetical protein